MATENKLLRSKIPFCPSFRFTPNRGPHQKELKMGITVQGERREKTENKLISKGSALNELTLYF